MYGEAGTAYVYLCYGIHHLFNVVTNKKDVPHAILIRALEPIEGIPLMLQRTGKPRADHSLTRGPGNLSRALGLLTHHTGACIVRRDGSSSGMTAIGCPGAVSVSLRVSAWTMRPKMPGCLIASL